MFVSLLQLLGFPAAKAVHSPANEIPKKRALAARQGQIQSSCHAPMSAYCHVGKDRRRTGTTCEEASHESANGSIPSG
jgi:hypothetical protein